jgi:hypothetical protein
VNKEKTMSKHTINGHIFWQMTKYMNEPRFGFIEYDIRQWRESDRDGRVHVCEHSFEVELPDDFDPRPQQIAMLDEEIRQTRAEFARRINDLQEQKSRLLAIEHTA